MLAAIALSAVMLLQQQCDPAVDMCWTLPVFPGPATPTPIPLTLPTPQHSSDYATYQPTADARLDQIVAPISTANDTVDQWLGAGSGTAIPETEGGDVETGLTPIAESGTLLEYAAELGVNIAELFQMARALLTISNSGLGIFVLAMLGSAALFAINEIFIRAIQIGDMLINLFDKIFTWLVELWQSIPFI
jgi:hypothetical protein